MKILRIGPFFSVPRNYRREFIFDDAETGFRHTIVIDAVGVHITDNDVATERSTVSKCLDWIEESIMAVRKEVGDL